MNRWFLFGATIPLLLVLLLPHQLEPVMVPAGSKLRAYREGIMDSVAVIEYFDGNRSLLVNNRFTMGGTGAAVAERRHASIPLLLHPQPKSALFLGLGTGISFAGARVQEGLKADGVELVPEIVQSLSWFSPQNSLAPEPNGFHVYVADARRFVKAAPWHYDVIVADLFHPARDGAGALYSLEHFRAIRERLTPGGLFCQWLPLFQLDMPMLRVITRTFLEVFPDARLFVLRFNVDTPVLGLIATMQPPAYGPNYFEERLGTGALRERLNSDQLRDAFHLFGCFVGDAEALRRFAQGAPLNTDDHPVVVFGAPQLGHQEEPYTRLFQVLQACASGVDHLVSSRSAEGQEFARQLADFIAARDVYLAGLAAAAQGRQSQAIDAYIESARRSPQFATGYAEVLTMAMRQSKAQPKAARKLLERLVEAQPGRPVAAQLLQRLSKE